MSTTFPRTRRSKPGYRPDEVDSFLQAARRSFDAGRDVAGSLRAHDIRRVAFSMERGGYLPSAVDAALERLEDAFAGRERERSVSETGEKAWFGSTRKLAKEIIARLNREAGHRFSRTGLLGIGYSPKEVDRFTEQVRSYFEQGTELAVEDVRLVAFRPKRRGYREAEVDLLIDGVVEVMLAVR